VEGERSHGADQRKVFLQQPPRFAKMAVQVAVAVRFGQSGNWRVAA
jgi:hypothetical protein